MDAIRSAGAAATGLWPPRQGAVAKPGAAPGRSPPQLRTVTRGNLGVLCAKLEQARRQLR